MNQTWVLGLVWVFFSWREIWILDLFVRNNYDPINWNLEARCFPSPSYKLQFCYLNFSLLVGHWGSKLWYFVCIDIITFNLFFTLILKQMWLHFMEVVSWEKLGIHCVLNSLEPYSIYVFFLFFFFFFIFFFFNSIIGESDLNSKYLFQKQHKVSIDLYLWSNQFGPVKALGPPSPYILQFSFLKFVGMVSDEVLKFDILIPKKCWSGTFSSL